MSSGIIETYDLAMMRLILHALRKLQNITYGIVLNCIPIGKYRSVAQRSDEYKKYINGFMSIETDHIYFYKENWYANSRSDYLLPQDVEFYRYVDSIEPTILRSTDIDQIKNVAYEKIATCISELCKAKKERAQIMLEPSSNEKNSKLETNSARIDQINKTTEYVCNGEEVSI